MASAETSALTMRRLSASPALAFSRSMQRSTLPPPKMCFASIM